MRRGPDRDLDRTPARSSAGPRATGGAVVGTLLGRLTLDVRGGEGARGPDRSKHAWYAECPTPGLRNHLLDGGRRPRAHGPELCKTRDLKRVRTCPDLASSPLSQTHDQKRASAIGIYPEDVVDPVPEPGVRRAERLCEKAVTVLGVDGAGLSMMTTAGHRGTVCATDQIARRIEDLQFTLGEGPCYDAFIGSGPILVPDINAATSMAASSWPVFTEEVAAAGVGALFAFPLMIGAIPLGALDFYRCRPGELSSDQLATAWDIADAAAGSLLDMRSGTGLDLPEESAPRGASYRLEVHQATGMISVQLETALDEALLLLRAYAFAEDIDIDDVARDVVAGRLHLTRERD
jgi:hypothetical protein